MVKWESIARRTRPVVATVGLLTAGLLAASAFGAEPKPDPAPPTTTAAKVKAVTTTKPKARTVVTTTATKPRRPVTTSTYTASGTTTPTRTRTSPKHTAVERPTTRRSAVTRQVVKTPVTKKTKKRVGKAVRAKAHPQVAPRSRVTPTTKRIAPASGTPAAPASGGHGGLIRDVLLALAVLSLALALLPWGHVFYPRIRPSQALRVRVAFATISLSVGFGYVITTYLNGSV